MIKTITLHPSRIGCPSIPGTMKGIVMSIPGVEDVKVRYEERSLDVTFDEAKTSENEIIKKIGQEMGLAMEVGETHGAKKQGNVSGTCPM
ncbi:MAG: cation transporter [bacterium]|nr:cation transporter [bacterium]